MRVLVASRIDPASMNIRDRLLESGTFEETGRTFRDSPVWARSETILVEVAGPSIHDETLDNDLKATGWPLMDVWFLSKHAAKSGHPSLTVHPIGNHTEAQYGGKPGELSPCSPRDMGALLRRLKHHAKEAGLPHSITYESTHHGPTMTIPTLWVEIGSDLQWYNDRQSGEVVARAINDVLAGDGKSNGPILVGVGGGHYVPRATDVALAGKADFGHFLPSHFVDETAGPEALSRAIAATPGCSGVHIHKKALKGPQRQAVQGWLDTLGILAWSSADGE
ncbi:MAG TPA: D-aminoacyl-tRNA deacylase [Candidatus Thermoplasmatota archaeon]|nr:D-aminoacyl-tRNA deacylase [Candidatus Thermoplasmatota archaeon]